eukprot:SAG31_NODE_5685_length_2380_cov_5.534415_1_plen_590_part_10
MGKLIGYKTGLMHKEVEEAEPPASAGTGLAARQRNAALKLQCFRAWSLAVSKASMHLQPGGGGRDFGRELPAMAEAARRLLARAHDLQAQPQVAMTGTAALRRGRFVHLRGAIATSATAFVPHSLYPAGQLATPFGEGQSAIHLHGTHGSQKPSPIEAIDEIKKRTKEKAWMSAISPDRKLLLVTFRVDHSVNRIKIFEVCEDVPWPIICAIDLPGDVLIGAEFGSDGTWFATCHIGKDEVIVYDTKTGSRRKSMAFGLPRELTMPFACISFRLRVSKELLAVSGGGKDSNAVGIWRVSEIESEEQATTARLEYLGCEVGPVALCDKHVAVGTRHGEIRLHKIESQKVQDWWVCLAQPPKHSVETQTELALTCLNFSHDGTMLAASRSNGQTLVFDAESTAPLFTFQQNDCTSSGGLTGFDMLLLAFSLDDTKLATGGGSCLTVEVHEISPIQMQRFQFNDASTDHPPRLTGAAVSAQYVALVAGTRVVVQLHNGEAVANIDMGHTIVSNMNGPAICLQPGRGHFAVVLESNTVKQNAKQVVAYDTVSALRVGTANLPTGHVCTLSYSPNGEKLLLLTLTDCLYIYNAAS